MLNSVAVVAATKHPVPDAGLRAQAKGLEGIFLNTLTTELFSTIKTDGAFGGGFGEETWRSMQSEQMADAIAQSGGVGLADQITSNLLDVQQSAQSSLQSIPQGAYAR